MAFLESERRKWRGGYTESGGKSQISPLTEEAENHVHVTILGFIALDRGLIIYNNKNNFFSHMLGALYKNRDVQTALQPLASTRRPERVGRFGSVLLLPGSRCGKR